MSALKSVLTKAKRSKKETKKDSKGAKEYGSSEAGERASAPFWKSKK